MARCRIYLFTYKRGHLLTRAISGLLNQTFTEWICEIHNDCPNDTFPSDYISELKDSRFILKNHPINLGPTTSFNLAFEGCLEEYASILEDDNWWEPSFLQEMITLLDQNTKINIAWCNMKIWKEEINDHWIDTKNTIWPVEDTKNTAFNWPNYKQAMGALHSNGAMLYRGRLATNYIVPNNCDFNIMEAVRERTFEYPILFTNKVLANFSQTIQTNRNHNQLLWTGCQTMLLASYIQSSANEKKTFKETLAFYRKQQPSPIVSFFVANLFILKKRSFYGLFNLSDWSIILRWSVKHSFKLGFIKKYLRDMMPLYKFLVKSTNKH